MTPELMKAGTLAKIEHERRVARLTSLVSEHRNRPRRRGVAGVGGVALLYAEEILGAVSGRDDPILPVVVPVRPTR